MVLDIHTHHAAPQPQGVIARIFDGETLVFNKDQAYSVGIHPWNTLTEVSDASWEKMVAAASLPQVVAIGETGIDLAGKGGALFRQLNVFRRHIELSETLGKPLVIHDVKAHDIIIGLRRDMRPTQNWAIHGFRGKPQVADMLLRAGCYISFGAEFNRMALLEMPEDLILAETDESPLTIGQVIARLSDVRDKDMTETIAANSQRFLNKPAE